MDNKHADKTTILFLCTGNSCRTQTAEGWAKTLKIDKFDAYYAGIEKQTDYYISSFPTMP